MKKQRVGDGTPGPGRPKGQPNRVTRDVREAMARFAEGNVSRLQAWLDAVAEKDPGRAAELFLRALEYHVPKLARSEMQHSGEIGFKRRLIIED